MVEQWTVKMNKRGLLHAGPVCLGTGRGVYAPDKPLGKIRWAHASLIAAAPDMLAQLQAIVVQLEASPGLVVSPGIRDAITRATK